MKSTSGGSSPGTAVTRKVHQVPAAAAITAAAFGAVLLYRLKAGAGYPLDDSWIHLAYARNFAAGHGFGVSPGEPTPGATSPLWVMLLVPGFIFGRAHAVWPWALGAVTLAGAGLAAMRLVSRWDGESGQSGVAPVAAGLCVALCGPLIWSAAGAMEVPLFSLLVLLTLYAFSSTSAAGARRGGAWGACAGLAALARPEGLLLVPLGLALSLVRRPRAGLVEPLVAAGAAAAVYAPSVLFCLATNGRVFPNTFYAKTTALVSGVPDVAYLGAAARFFLGASPVAAAAFALALVAGLAAGRAPAGVLFALAFSAALPLAYAAMGRTYLFAGIAGNFGRYLYPVLPTAIVAGWWGYTTLARRAGAAASRLAGPAVLALAVVASAAGAYSRAGLYARNVRDINTMQVAIAHRLAATLPAGALVAANDVGALAYFGDFRVLDLIGIISTPTLERLEAAGEDPQARSAALVDLLREQRPDALVVFPEWFRLELSALDGRLTPLAEVHNPANITSGGVHLAAFKVDWTR